MKIIFMPHSVEHYNIGLLSNLSRYVSVYTSYRFKGYKFFKYIKGKKFISKTYEYLFSPFADILHANSAFQADPIWRIKKTIITSHGFPLPQIELIPKYRRYYIMEAQKLKMLYNMGVPIVSISKFTEEMLEKLYKIRSYNVIYHGVLPIFFIKRRKNRISNKFIILYISRLHLLKEPIVLLKAFKNIYKNFNNIELIIKGSGPLLNFVLKYVFKENLSEKVKIITKKLPINDFIGLYRNASIFVHTARYEPFGLAVLEAMASGLPVIVPKMGGAYEIVGNAGACFSPGDPDDLSEKILKIVYDEKLRYSMSKKAVERAKEFSWEKSAKEYIKSYIDLIS